MGGGKTSDSLPTTHMRSSASLLALIGSAGAGRLGELQRAEMRECAGENQPDNRRNGNRVLEEHDGEQHTCHSQGDSPENSDVRRIGRPDQNRPDKRCAAAERKDAVKRENRNVVTAGRLHPVQRRESDG